jgi:hypothetical protein
MPATEPAKVCPARRSRRRLWIVAIACGLTGFFAVYVVVDHRDEQRWREEARRQFLEFLQVGTDLGFVTINRQRLDELIITMSEAEWEDRDAEDRQRTMSTTTTISEGR